MTATNTINRAADIGVTTNSFTTTLPPQSITLFVLAAATSNNQPPVAAISATPASGTAPLNVGFSGAGSYDADGSINSYAWNFGDGTSASGVTTNHNYTTPGIYTARLTVTDNQGTSSSKTTTIQVNPTPAIIPSAPSSLVATTASRTQINLNWADNATNEDGFKIERCSGASCTNFKQIAAVSANIKAYSNTGLKKNTAYRYRVRAFNATGNSTYSNIADAKTLR